MKQTRHFTNSKGTLTFIDLPKNVERFYIELPNVLGYSLEDTPFDVDYTSIPVKGYYTLIGYLKHIDESQAAEIMDHCYNGHNEMGYYYYEEDGNPNEEINCAFITALKSLFSLTENHLNIHLPKPMWKPEKTDKKYLSFDGTFHQAIYESELEVYEKYQRGCGNWFVIFTPNDY